MNSNTVNLPLPIVGNDGMASLILPWCALFREANPEISFDCTLEGSSTAIMALAADASWLAPMSRAPWPHELAAFERVKGYRPTEIHVGYTGHGPRPEAKSPPAIYVHRDNPLAGLTMAQLASVFSSEQSCGDITDWQQLGLEGKWHKRRIHLYGLRDNGKYATAFRHAHLAGRHYPAHYEGLADRRAVIEAVAQDPFGAGCLGWCNAALFSDDVRILPLASEANTAFYSPDLVNVAQGNYPLSSYVSLCFDLPPGATLDPLVKAWLEMTLSDEGQTIVADQTHSPEGYVPLEPSMLAYQRQRLANL
ncbi:PstS family phosphate ABC transporter substrate-binding protein [Rahnella contaminans]|uniref:PstS family phosphate ABC transporter substrate-binding protein n=1 Tax=Rahnella contaminans TaxID=2703882 RepID=UPI0023DCBA9B|nr:substrate-binding domain-containing protein [Rahnella contaminans]MDF1893109.1 substrate-binding domain-containing protein [Rahnella contaminans]